MLVDDVTWQASPASVASPYRVNCPVCKTHPRSHALVPCSHLFCENCSKGIKKCPTCRGPVISRQWVLSP